MKWFLSRLRGSSSLSLLASMDRWGVVHKTPRNDSSDCSLERLGPRRFALNIHSTQDSDAGDYHCTATPWIRSTATGLWSKAQEVSSKRVFLNVKFACEWTEQILRCVTENCTQLLNVTLKHSHASLTSFYTLMGGYQHLTLIPTIILHSSKTSQCMLEHACVILKD